MGVTMGEAAHIHMRSVTVRPARLGEFLDFSPNEIMRVLARAAALRALLLCARAPPPTLLFPGEPDVAPTPCTRDQLVGFWTVYDELAPSDALNLVAAGGSPRSMFGASMVLRADGKTSRGSEYPGGSWTLQPRDGKRHLCMTLYSRLKQQELRYDGIVLRVAFEPSAVTGEVEGAVEETLSGIEADAAALAGLRVVGRVTKWDVSDGEGKQLGGEEPFSMVQLEVNRTKLTPMIRPFSKEVPAEELEKEMKSQRAADRAEADELREVIKQACASTATYIEQVRAWVKRPMNACAPTCRRCASLRRRAWRIGRSRCGRRRALTTGGWGRIRTARTQTRIPAADDICPVGVERVTPRRARAHDRPAQSIDGYSSILRGAQARIDSATMRVAGRIQPPRPAAPD